MQASRTKLDADYIIGRCGSVWPHIQVLNEVGSTNDWVRQQNTRSAVCLAESQTQGRGRNGNSWLSPDAENIYLSYNWVFESAPRHLPLLSLRVGIAVAQVMQLFGVRDHGIKWPNDLYWQHKKLGGILIETSSASSEVIVGIGLNINASDIKGVDQPWASLGEILNKKVDRNEFVVQLLSILYRAMASFEVLQPEALLSSWAEWDLIKGKSVSFLHGGNQHEGVARGIDHFGHLLVEVQPGQIRAFNTSISKVRW